MPDPLRPSARRSLAARVGVRPRAARPVPPPVPIPARERVLADVTAVLVAHDGAAWLPEALAALEASTLEPVATVLVDTGSTDGSAGLLARAAAGPRQQLLTLPRTTGYGAAVAAGLAAADPAGWVWLLHDDCAVDPGALEALLTHAADSPSAGLLGPKVHDWDEPRLLVEVGVSTDAAGHRETGLERREHDQGQHDAVRDVLAVGTAAALVRRDLWDSLGGLEPALPLYRDELDLGWRAHAVGARVVVVPTATVRHARAATTGRRSTDAAPGRATALDRRHALWVLLAHASRARLAGLLPGLLLGTVLRVLGLLLSRQVAAAGDELRALTVLAHPGELRAARSRRSRARVVATRDFRALFVSRAVRLQSRLGLVADVLLRGAAVDAQGTYGSGDPDGPGLDVAPAGGGLLRRLLVRPGVLLTLGLLVVAAVAERSVLPFGGQLAGGALLPAPGGASDLWHTYTAAWHPTEVGSSGGAPPSVGVLALLSTVAFGKPWLAVDVLLLLAVPLSGAVAHAVAARVVRHRGLRVWAAASWALLPVATGAVATGRLDVAAVQVGLPLLALVAGRLAAEDVPAGGWWRAWAAGLGLSLLVALAPLLWSVALLVLIAGAVRCGLVGRLRSAVALAVVALTPLAALLPWSVHAVAHPGLLVPQHAPDVAVPTSHLLLLSPGGPGVPPALVTVGLLGAALAGAARLAHRSLALTAWAAALIALTVAVVLSHVRVRGSLVWTGVPLQVAGAGLLLAALVGASGLRTRLSRTSFGWRQVLAAVLAVTGGALPVAAGLVWLVGGADAPLSRSSGALLPAFAQSDLVGSPGRRVLVLHPRGGTVTYDLLDATGLRLDRATVSSSAGQVRRLSAVVADLASPRGSDAALALSTRAVRYVTLTVPDAQLTAVLDAQPGLVRRGPRLWLVPQVAARLSVLDPVLGAQALTGRRAPAADLLRTDPPRPAAAGVEDARGTLPSGPPGRLLVLADASDAGWQLRVDGVRSARRTAWGWATAFELPAAGGHYELTHDGGGRHGALAGELAALFVLGVLAAPGRRRGGALDDDVDTVELAPPAALVPA